MNIPFPSILQELKDYGEKVCFEDKVHRVHKMCIKTKRYKLSDKINDKYKHYFPKSDLVMAFMFSLKAMQEKNK